MNIGRKISTWMKDFFKPTKGSTEIFPKLDVDMVARELQVQQIAIAAGKDNLPETDSIELDPNERSIVEYINQRIHTAADQFEMQMNGYAQRLSSHIALINQNINEVTKNVLASIDVQMAKTFDIFINLKQEYEEAKNNYNSFRQQKNITRDAIYPTSKLNHYGLIVFIFFMEVAFNSYFFGQGSELGYLGGFFVSFTIGIFNIFISFYVLGNAVRFSLNPNMAKRVAAIFIILIFVSIVIGFNLYFAHFRNLFSIEGQAYALKNAWGALKSNIIVTDLHSILLFCTGMFACGVTSWKSATSDELIPYYGALQRTRDNKAAQFFEYKELYLDKLTHVKDEKLEELNKVKEDLIAAKDSYAYTLNKKNTFISLYSSHLQSLKSSGNTLLHKYRSLNKQHRKTPPPDHFADTIDFTPTIGIPPQENIEDATTELNKNYEVSVKQIEKCIDSTYELFTKYVEKFTSQSSNDLAGNTNV